MAVAPEQHWLPRYWEWRIGIAPGGAVTRDLLDMLLSDRRFAALDVPFKRVAELVDYDPPLHYGRFVARLFDLHGAAKGKRLVGEKTPKYVRYLATLNELWPTAKVVHMIRDGRDIALSLREWDKAERNVGRFPTWSVDQTATAALYWEWNVRLGREVGAGLGPDRYYELRYESLVADPESTCRRLCSFLAISYDSAMLRFHEGRTNSNPGLSAKKAWLPVTAGLRRWREQMASDDLIRFEAAAGDLLDELGYERGAPDSADEELAYAARLRDNFSKYAHSAAWRVPRAWTRVAA
jgi:hypothetical protein